MFSIKLENDDIQDFDLRWEHALLLTSDPPSDKVLEGLYVSKLQESSQPQTIMAVYNQDILLGGGKRDNHRLRMCVKLHIEQAQRSDNFRIQSENTEPCGRNQRKGAKFLYGSRSKGESCSFLHSRALGNRVTTAEEVENARVSGLKPAVNNERRRNGKEQASYSVPTGKGQTDVKSSTYLEASPATRAKILCLWARCKRSSCGFRHPPVCRDYKSGNRCVHGNNWLCRLATGEEKPSKKSKK